MIYASMKTMIRLFHSLLSLGLAAQLTYEDMTKEIIILDLAEFSEGQRAEDVKYAIENTINDLKFDKTKIRGSCLFSVRHFSRLFSHLKSQIVHSGVVTDEGSNLVRLFKQLMYKRTDVNVEQAENGKIKNQYHLVLGRIFLSLFMNFKLLRSMIHLRSLMSSQTTFQKPKTLNDSLCPTFKPLS